MENVGLMVALAGAMTKSPTAEQVTTAVDAWLDDHPEATTTVQDGAITNAKLATSFVTPGTASAYSSSATYAVGDYVFYNGALYRCISAISTAEAWTSAHWTAAVLGDDVGDLKEDLNVVSNRVLDLGITFDLARSEGDANTVWFGVAPKYGVTYYFENNSEVNVRVLGRKNGQSNQIIDTLYANSIKSAVIDDVYDDLGVYYYGYGSGKLNVYGSDYINKTVDAKIDAVFSPVSVSWITGYYIRYSDGEFIASSSSQYSGYVDCTNIDFIVLNSYISTAGATLAFYDDTKTYLKNISVQGTNAVQQIAMAVPANAKYFACCHYGSNEKSIAVYTKMQKTTNKLCGLKAMFFGDSITANASGYRKYLAEENGLVDIASFAINGATLTNLANTVMDGNPTSSANNTVPNQVKKMINGNYGTPDIVVVSASTNDDESHFTYKESEYQVNGSYIDVDTCDLTNASGAMRWIYEKIMSVYPSAKVFFATPIQSATPYRTFDVLKKKRDVIVENAERMSVCYIDAFYKSGIYSRYETDGSNGKYLADGLHPNSSGAAILAVCYENEMNINLR